MSDESDYAVNAIKRDPATNMLAQRTTLGGERAWRVFRPDGPPHYVAHADIEGWADMEATG